MIRGAPIYTDGNDDEAEEALTRKASFTGALEPATGLLGLSFRLSATKGGAAIHSSLDKAAAERGVSGKYYAIFEGSDLTAQLGSAYWNTDIFQVFGDGVNVNFNVVRRVLAKRP